MGSRTLSGRSLLRLSAFVSVLAFAGLEISILPPAPQATTSKSDEVLSGIDRAHYRQAFNLQRTGSFAEADKELGMVSDHLLTGTVLAERYLNKQYTPHYSELETWLAANSDSPAAEDIYRLALAHKPAQATLEEPAFSKSQKYTSGYSKSALHDNKAWAAGLSAYKRNDMGTAAHHFRSLADGDNALSPDDKAAASFWAYRALKAQGDEAMASRYLDKTSDYPSGFYSLLAHTLTGDKQGTTENAAKPVPDIASLFTQTPVKRAVALKQIGENMLAEREIRALYHKADGSTRTSLMELARQLDLPAAQLCLPVSGAAGKEAFPIPNWQPTSGYVVERALVFAFMRQESGFDPNARSASGAVGLMQLMPATAYAMAHESRQLGKSSDPSINLTLGQRYLENLMSTPQIGDNLIYLTAAYNAGPGAVANWLHKGNNEKDPLMFVESLPYGQTREYVMHVITNYWIYSQLLGVNDPSSLRSLAAGEWPRYEGAERQLVALLNRAD